MIFILNGNIFFLSDNISVMAGQTFREEYIRFLRHLISYCLFGNSNP